MSEFISCFACDKEPTQQCPRCGRPYCDDHGEELCDACLEPASGVPSFTLYRGSLLALLVGTALAVWLLVQPGTSDGEVSRPQVVTPTAVVAAGGGTTTAQTPQANTTPAANTSPTSGAATQPAGTTATRPATTATPASGTTPGAGGSTNYTVVAGDTLGAICEKVRPASMTNADCIAQIVSLNALSSVNATISIGQTLRVPAR